MQQPLERENRPKAESGPRNNSEANLDSKSAIILARNVKNWRKSQNPPMTAKDLAELVGIPETSLNRIEQEGVKQRKRGVSLVLLDQLAKAMNLTPQELLKP